MEPEYAFVAEYPCDRHCRIELDTTAIHLAFSHRRMRDAADALHVKQHPEIGAPAKAEKPQPPRTPIYDGLQATFKAPAPPTGH